MFSGGTNKSEIEKSGDSGSSKKIPNLVGQKRTIDSENTASITFSQLNQSVFNSFLALYDSVPVLVSLAHALPDVFLQNVLEPICASAGKLITKKDDYRFYELDISNADMMLLKINQMHSLVKVNSRLIDNMLLGLVAEYDHFISNLARLLLEKKPHILGESDRHLTYADVLELRSIDEIRVKMSDDVVENLLRKSHEEQLKWFGERLQIKIDPDIELLAKFLELCERRNLIAHAGGTVSHRYIQLCSKYDITVDRVSVGKKLVTNSEYFEQASATIIELAAQLVHIVWQKLEGGKSEAAAKALIDITFKLIRDRKFKLAIRLLKFLLNNKSTQMDEATKRTHKINLANAMKLDGMPDYLKEIDDLDWSASTLTMRTCIAAIRDDENAFLINFKKAIKANELSVADLREWPVFESVRNNKNIMAEISKIIGKKDIESFKLINNSTIHDSLFAASKRNNPAQISSSNKITPSQN